VVITIPFPGQNTSPMNQTTTSTQNYTATVISKGTVVRLPMLEIQVSPPGFPEVGQFWKINVFLINKTDNQGNLVYESAPDSIIIVTVPIEAGQKKYELVTNENGEAPFQYVSEYKGVSFQAKYADDLVSPEITLSNYFVPSDVVDTLLYYNVFSVVGSLASGFLIKPDVTARYKSWRRLSRTALFCSIALFAFVTLSSLISKTFEGTTWGYPNKILNSPIDFTLLRYVFYIAVLLLISAWIVNLAIEGMSKKEK